MGDQNVLEMRIKRQGLIFMLLKKCTGLISPFAEKHTFEKIITFSGLKKKRKS